MDYPLYAGVLRDLGINLGAGLIFEFFKKKFGTQQPVAKASFEKEFATFLKIHGVTAEAATVIKAFADSGLLSIKESHLIAPAGILIGAGEGGRFSFGQNSSSRTAKTAIYASGDARVEGANAAVSQNADGSIDFLVGRAPGNKMVFSVGSDTPVSGDKK